MEVIDGAWIKARLTGQRGEKTRLAEALGIGTDMMSKVISGARRLNAREAAIAMEYFQQKATLSPKAAAILERIERLSPAGQKRAEALLDALLMLESAQRDDQDPHP